MAKINLLPAEFRKERQVSQPVLMIKMAGIIFAAALICVYVLFLLDYSTKKQEIAAMDRELAGYQEVLAKYNALNKDSQSFKETQSFLKAIQDNRVSWAPLLKEIKADVDNEITVTELSTTEDNGIVLKGQAQSLASAGKLYLKLTKLSSVRDLSLDITTDDSVPGTIGIVNFSIQGHLERGGRE